MGQPDSFLERTFTPPRLACLALLLAGLAAYHNSFSVPLLFDDYCDILANPVVRNYWPSWTRFVSDRRQVVVFSFALNHSLSDFDVRAYHATNLIVHLLAALTLFGLVRRTLLLAPAPGIRRRPSGSPWPSRCSGWSTRCKRRASPTWCSAMSRSWACFTS